MFRNNGQVCVLCAQAHFTFTPEIPPFPCAPPCVSKSPHQSTKALPAPQTRLYHHRCSNRVPAARSHSGRPTHAHIAQAVTLQHAPAQPTPVASTALALQVRQRVAVDLVDIHLIVSCCFCPLVPCGWPLPPVLMPVVALAVVVLVVLLLVIHSVIATTTAPQAQLGQPGGYLAQPGAAAAAMLRVGCRDSG